MIYDQMLTKEQRKKSQFNYIGYNAINGASYMCIGETIIILFANKLGAPAYIISIIGAMLYFSYLLIPLGLLRTAKVGAAKSLADFWLYRNLAALLIPGSLLVHAHAPMLSYLMIILGAFLFYGFRGAGVVMAFPLMGEITDESDRAKFFGASNAFFYLLGVIALISSNLVLKVNNDVKVISGIICAGILIGFTALPFINRIDETSEIRKSAQHSFWSSIKIALTEPTMWRQIFAGCAVSTSIILLVPLTIPILTKCYHVSDSLAVTLSIVQFAAMIAGSYFGGILATKFGPRRVIIAGFAEAFLIAIFWTVVPAELPKSWYSYLIMATPFALNGILAAIAPNSLGHYFLSIVPKERQVSGILFMQLAVGVMAGVMGMVLSSVFLKVANTLFTENLQVFKCYYLFTFVFLAIGLIPMFRLPKLK
ncbi:MAG: hypothetical protein IJW31_04275 [Lentisphaeria bacterium]|nr:hypothetical protein [Lentisphaeria bacterium]